jgi:hypothetical protein
MIGTFSTPLLMIGTKNFFTSLANLVPSCPAFKTTQLIKSTFFFFKENIYIMISATPSICLTESGAKAIFFFFWVRRRCFFYFLFFIFYFLFIYIFIFKVIFLLVTSCDTWHVVLVWHEISLVIKQNIS